MNNQEKNRTQTKPNLIIKNRTIILIAKKAEQKEQKTITRLQKLLEK